MPNCSTCSNRYFSTKQALKQHMEASATSHPYCRVCDRLFNSMEALRMHSETSSRHHNCKPCNRTFATPEALRQHRQSMAHSQRVHPSRGFLMPSVQHNSLFSSIASPIPNVKEMHVSTFESHSSSVNFGHTRTRSSERLSPVPAPVICYSCQGHFLTEDLLRNHGCSVVISQDEEKPLLVDVIPSTIPSICLTNEAMASPSVASTSDLRVCHQPNLDGYSPPERFTSPRSLPEDIRVCRGPRHINPQRSCSASVSPYSRSISPRRPVPEDLDTTTEQQGVNFSEALATNPYVAENKSVDDEHQLTSDQQLDLKHSVRFLRSDSPENLPETPATEYPPSLSSREVASPTSSLRLTSSPSDSDISRSYDFHSPSVSPPEGLAPLPAVSPLELTPVDIPRGTHEKLMALQLNSLFRLPPILSPSEGVSDELRTPSSLTPSSPASAVMSPQEIHHNQIYGDSLIAERLPLPVSLEASPIDPGLPNSLPTSWNNVPAADTGRLLSSNITTAPTRTSAVQEVEPSPTIISTLSSVYSPSDHQPGESQDAQTELPVNEGSPLSPPTLNPQRLHCRVCQRDPCLDMTATMCGHIFCNRCITEAVIRSPRCPRCATPTLLYCLFRIDLFT